jgi:hypothetical protein
MLSMILGFRRSRPFHTVYNFGTQAKRPFHAVYDFEIQTKRSLHDFCSSGFRQSALSMLSMILGFRRTRRLQFGFQAKRSLYVVYDSEIQAIAPSAVRISGKAPSLCCL